MVTFLYLAASLLALAAGCGGSDDALIETPGATSARDAGAASDAGASSLDARVRAPSEGPGRDAGQRDDVRASSVYVGGWDWQSGQPYPLRSFTLRHADGSLAPAGAPSDLGFNPSHLTASLDGRFVYAANELEGAHAGLSVARVEGADGALARIQQVSYADGAFVFARVHPSGRYLFAADYYAGKLVVYRLGADGKLGAVAASETFPRASADVSAQSHAVGIHDNGRFVYVPNKARDSIAQLSFDADTGALTQRDDVPSAGGPRHIALYGNLAYVMHENDSHLTSFQIDDDGALTPVDTASTLPDGATERSTGAQVTVHPSGTFVYASNRGHDSIAVFATTAEGRLSRVGTTKTAGKTPRSFDIDPNGELLIVANQGSDGADDGSLVVFAIGGDGLLTQRGAPIAGLKSPTTVLLVPRVPR